MSTLNKLKTFLFLRRNSCLEEDRVRPVLGVEEGHVAVHLTEQVHTLVPFLVTSLVQYKDTKLGCRTWKWESSSERVLGQPGHLKVHREVTFTGGFRVIWAIRKFMARSSQLTKSSTMFLMSGDIMYV